MWRNLIRSLQTQSRTAALLRRQPNLVSAGRLQVADGWKAGAPQASSSCSASARRFDGESIYLFACCYFCSLSIAKLILWQYSAHGLISHTGNVSVIMWCFAMNLRGVSDVKALKTALRLKTCDHLKKCRHISGKKPTTKNKTPPKNPRKSSLNWN